MIYGQNLFKGDKAINTTRQGIKTSTISMLKELILKMHM
jgi:hypothetical protein